MRVHRLELEAFGPFVERQVVDLDALSAQHLFLLHGETGAGKTTVLDALCFGLYGVVPGVRQGAGHLRSDHAAPDAEPRVVLEVTVGSRRLRLTRSPKWQRPKKRGAGTTTAQASVTLQERVEGEWVHLSSRIDETNQLVGSLVGLSPEQFCQVVLLPQGQFASFLRAGSDERRGLLQKIFDTGRFADVERWLVDRRIETRRDSEGHHNGVRSLLARITEAAAHPWPEQWPADDVVAVAASGEVAELAAELLDDSDRQVAATRFRATAAQREQESTRAACDAAERLTQEVARASSARDALAGLDARADHLTSLAARHDAGVRARPVTEARRVAGLATTRLSRARDAASTSHTAAEAALSAHTTDGRVHDTAQPDARAVAQCLERAHRRRAEAAALVPVQHEAEQAGRDADRLVEQHAAHAASLAALEQGAAEIPDRRRVLLADVARVRSSAGELGGALASHDVAATRLRAAHDVESLTRQLVESRDRVLLLVQQAQDLREAYLDRRERRVAGMAGELALALAVGQDCPVCGSCEHPSPATRGEAAESQHTEDEARRAAEDAAVTAQAAEQDVVRVQSHLEHARERCGGLDVGAAGAATDAAARSVATARAAVDRLDTLESDVERLDAEQLEHEQRLTDARNVTAACAASLAAAQERARRCQDQLATALHGFAGPAPSGVSADDRRDDPGGPGAPGDADGWHELFSDHVGRLTGLLRALDEQRDAHQQWREASTRLDEVALECGFTDHQAAADAAVDAARLEDMAGELARAERDRQVATQTLSGASPEARSVLDGTAPAPDVHHLRAHLGAAERGCRTATTAADAQQERRRRLGRLVDDLTGRLDAWRPVREHLRVLGDLAATVEGKGPDNPLQMRLSAYVLASRLSQVVAAANERLAAMAEQRYELEHTAFRGAGDRRGGLSLRVVDSWTGDPRDPATLSGGETFVVALALALGLADVVTQEAGGAEIDTLFVDEGFGSLDPTTLDRVMDCLDDLRSGGRSVGVVSHVAELRSRIPDQLHVVKTPRGSTVTARHGAAGDADGLLVGTRG